MFKFYEVFDKFNINGKHILQPRLIDIVQKISTLLCKVFFAVLVRYIIYTYSCLPICYFNVLLVLFS